MLARRTVASLFERLGAPARHGIVDVGVQPRPPSGRNRMNRTTLLLSSALALLPFAPAFAQDAGEVTIVLGEEIDLVEPCMATRSNIGRVIMQNVSETLTQY